MKMPPGVAEPRVGDIPASTNSSWGDVKLPAAIEERKEEPGATVSGDDRRACGHVWSGRVDEHVWVS